MRLSRRQWLAGAVGVLFAGRAAATVSFLPATDAPVLLLMDADALSAERLARIAALGYALDRNLVPDCSVTESALLAARLQLAPYVVAILNETDHRAVKSALREGGATVLFDGALKSAAAADQPLLRELREVLLASGGSRDLQALIARRD